MNIFSPFCLQWKWFLIFLMMCVCMCVCVPAHLYPWGYFLLNLPLLSLHWQLCCKFLNFLEEKILCRREYRFLLDGDKVKRPNFLSNWNKRRGICSRFNLLPLFLCYGRSCDIDVYFKMKRTEECLAEIGCKLCLDSEWLSILFMKVELFSDEPTSSFFSFL